MTIQTASATCDMMDRVFSARSSCIVYTSYFDVFGKWARLRLTNTTYLGEKKKNHSLILGLLVKEQVLIRWGKKKHKKKHHWSNLGFLVKKQVLIRSWKVSQAGIVFFNDFESAPKYIKRILRCELYYMLCFY